MSRQTNRELIRKLKSFRASCTVWQLDFRPTADLSREAQKALEKELHESFLLWWDTWIAPLIDAIEPRLIRKNKGV